MSKAFVINHNPTVRWPVTVRIPQDGQLEEWRFTGVFKVLSESEFEAWDVPVDERDANRPLSTVLADNADKFARVLVGWDGVMDPEGRPVPFSDDLLKAEITGRNGRALSVGINTALAQIRFGVAPDQPGAALGNSEAPRAAG